MVEVYVLENVVTGRYYVGVSGRSEDRLVEHNRGQTRSTKGGRWRKAWSEEHPDMRSAMAREREIKGWKSRARISALVDPRGR